MRAFLGAAAAVVGVTLGAVVTGHGLLAPWWLYLAFGVAGAAAATRRRRRRPGGRHRA